MTRVLLTGGSGFIALRILESLLSRGHSVVTSVRSREKADQIRKSYPEVTADKLGFVFVEDIAQSDAFDKAVIADPPFECVIHAASPFHHDVKDAKRDMIDPAVIGTTGILKAVKKRAPSVKRVVITSSFAAMLNPGKPKGEKYSEADWNPVTVDEFTKNPASPYRASKTFAERAAWDFMKTESPKFSLVVLNPTLVLGPINTHVLSTLASINTSNQRIRDMLSGASKSRCPPTGSLFWVDVRDAALAHVLAAEKPDAEVGGQRFFITAGPFCNRQIVEIIARDFGGEFGPRLPRGEEALAPGDWTEGANYGFENARSRDVLGVSYRGLGESVGDTVRSLKPLLEE